MRKTHQKTKILYEIRSEINFFKRGKKRQVTYYGSDTPISKFNLIKRAEDNIKKKFEESDGRIISVKLVNVYQ